MSLLLGLVFFILVGKDLAGNPKNFTDLFVYNYDRPYPFELDARAIRFGDHVLATGDVVAGAAGLRTGRHHPDRVRHPGRAVAVHQAGR